MLTSIAEAQLVSKLGYKSAACYTAIYMTALLANGVIGARDSRCVALFVRHVATALHFARGLVGVHRCVATVERLCVVGQNALAENLAESQSKLRRKHRVLQTHRRQQEDTEWKQVDNSHSCNYQKMNLGLRT